MGIIRKKQPSFISKILAKSLDSRSKSQI